jgi:hypothetical protein
VDSARIRTSFEIRMELSCGAFLSRDDAGSLIDFVVHAYWPQ